METRSDKALTISEQLKAYILSYNQRAIDEFYKNPVFDMVYCYPDTRVLKNLFSIQNPQVLAGKERQITSRNLVLLHMEPIRGHFDNVHLRKIHYVLFKELYPFAGQLRTIDLSKGGTNFCEVSILPDYLNETLQHMNRNIRRVSNREDYIKFLAKYYSDLNMAHPFREGNGRTIREFMREFVNYYSNILEDGLVELDYSKMDGERLLEGTIQSVSSTNDLLEDVFASGLVSVSKEENLEKYTK